MADSDIAATAINWQPLSTFPFGTKWANACHVLCCHDEKRWLRFGRHYAEIGRWYYSGTNERSQWSETAGDAPTHWAPIPALPAHPTTPTKGQQP